MSTSVILKENPNIQAKQDSIVRRIMKWDGWENVMTGLGMMGRDKRMSAMPTMTMITQQDAEALYAADDIGGRIIDRPVHEMFREGFNLNIDGDKETPGAIMEEWKRLLVDARLEEAVKWGRLYGGALLVIGIQGQDPSLPLDMKSIPRIEYFAVLDRHRVNPGQELISDLSSPEFGLPAYYTLNNVDPKSNLMNSGNAVQMNQGQKRIHHSRVIRLDGVELPWALKQSNNYWGNSVYVRLINVLRNFNTSHDSVATIMQDFAQMVLKMKGLQELLLQGKDDLITRRFALATRMSSIVNALVIQEGEEIERKTTNVSGIADIVKIVNARLVAATDMPHTILLGESPSGLGATGESEMDGWYDHIKDMQESQLRPKQERILDLICAQKSGPTKGIIPEYELKYIPLGQPSEKEIVETRKIQAETDQIYLSNQVVDPEEIARSRFGEGGYSIETVIDFSLRDNPKDIEIPEDEDDGGTDEKPEDGLPS